MKTFKYIFYLSISLFSCTISAQETYFIFSNPKAPGHFSIYKCNLMQSDSSFKQTKYDNLVVDISRDRFVSSSGLKTGFLEAFQFSADRNLVYIAGENGDLYRYTIDEDKLEFLVDLLPDSVGNPARLHTLVWGDDSTLYFGGSVHGAYNVDTGEFPIKPKNYYKNPNLYSLSMVKYKGRYIYTSVYKTLMELDVEDPNNSKLLYDYSVLPIRYFPNVMLYQFDCDSVELCISLDFKRSDIPWYMVNIDDNAFSFEELIPVEALGAKPTTLDGGGLGLNFFNYYDDCSLIDLDIDNSTIGGNDFFISQSCYNSGIPISDTDVRVGSAFPFDSITINIKNAYSLQYVGVSDGNYDIIRPNTADIALVNNGSTTNEDFEYAIANAMYFDGATRKGLDIEIEFLVWENGLPRDTAIAYIEIAEQLHYAGEDIHREYCQEEKFIDLYSLLDSEISRSGNFVDTDFNKIGSDLDISKGGIFKGFYVVNVEECSDTAFFEIIVNKVPDISPINDTLICYGGIYEVDLSYPNLDIEWSDGLEDEIRVISTAGTYTYKVINEHGCYSYDTFTVFWSEQSVKIPVEADICEGDTFPFLGKEYYEIGNYFDTLRNSIGCDSVYFYIRLNHFEGADIILTGNLGFCEGGNTVLKVESEHTDLKLNGENVQSTIKIVTPGSYLLTGYYEKCISQLYFEVLEYPNPQIFSENVVELDFSEPIKIPVAYSDGVISYNWTPRSGLDCYDCPYPNILTAQNMLYTVEVTDENRCVSTDSISVVFKELEYYFPNTIFNNPVHPDNGVFYIKSKEAFYYNMEIYDRWGNVLYRAENISTNDPSGGWSPQGKVNPGVFVYKIELNDYGNKKVIAGDITVL